MMNKDDKNSPLMFIQTVNNLNNVSKNQEFFDTRCKKNKLEEPKSLDKKIDMAIVEKLEKLIKCYNCNLKVYVRITLDNNELYEGVVSNIFNDVVLINDLFVSIFEIIEIKLIKFDF